MYLTYQWEVNGNIYENVVRSDIKSEADGHALVQEYQDTASSGGEIYFFRRALDGDFNNGQKFVGRVQK
jgi:hypothetical protein